MEEIIIPEELILNTLEVSLHHELPDLIGLINREKGEKWLNPFRTIRQGTQCYDEMPRPLCLISLNRTGKSSRDPFVEQGEYSLTLKVLLDVKDPDYFVYRYAYVLNRLLKKSESLGVLYDRSVMEECLCQNRSEVRGAEGHFSIKLYREDLK